MKKAFVKVERNGSLWLLVSGKKGLGRILKMVDGVCCGDGALCGYVWQVFELTAEKEGYEIVNDLKDALNSVGEIPF